MTSKAREEILTSIDKMMFTEIEIDATAEVNAGWNKKAKYKGPLIPSERVEVIKLNGQEVIDCDTRSEIRRYMTMSITKAK